jgi:biotin carboxyl carrier protein
VSAGPAPGREATKEVRSEPRPRLGSVGPDGEATAKGVTTIQIRIPKLGMEMTEGTLAQWLVDDGAAVAQDEPLYLLETDKVESEITAPSAGVLRRVGVAQVPPSSSSPMTSPTG